MIKEYSGSHYDSCSVYPDQAQLVKEGPVYLFNARFNRGSNRGGSIPV